MKLPDKRKKRMRKGMAWVNADRNSGFVIGNKRAQAYARFKEFSVRNRKAKNIEHKILARLHEHLLPDHAQIRHWISELRRAYGLDAADLALITGESAATIRFHRVRTRHLMVILFLLYSIGFKPENIRTWRSIMTWGKLH